MAKRNPVSNWFANQLYNTSLVWLLGLVVAGAIFYTTSLSKWEITDKRFDLIEAALKEQKTALIEKAKGETVEREKIRSEFVSDSKATATGMAELNKQTAVIGTVLSQVKDELVKLNQRVDSLPTGPIVRTR